MTFARDDRIRRADEARLRGVANPLQEVVHAGARERRDGDPTVGRPRIDEIRLGQHLEDVATPWCATGGRVGCAKP